MSRLQQATRGSQAELPLLLYHVLHVCLLLQITKKFMLKSPHKTSLCPYVHGFRAGQSFFPWSVHSLGLRQKALPMEVSVLPSYGEVGFFSSNSSRHGTQLERSHHLYY